MFAGIRLVDVSSRSFEHASRSSGSVFEDIYDPITRQGLFPILKSMAQSFPFFFLTFSFFFRLIQVPSQHCSQAMASEMALLAYNRAVKLSKPGLVLNQV